MRRPAADAVVVGAGPNGLVAANLLADAGWDVVVLEATAETGGAVRSGELTLPGFVHDLFSAFYPLAVASPVVRALEPERWGVRWLHGPLVVSHPLPDGRCASLSRDLDEAAASLDAFAPGDGDAWRALDGLVERVREPLLGALLSPFPPLRAGASLLLRGRGRLGELARLAAVPVRRLAEERFRGEGASLLLTGNALHADLAPEQELSAFYGVLLCALGRQVGFPTPAGGAGALAGALRRRLEAAGGSVECGRRVTSVLVRGGRAVGVAGDGFRVDASRAVVAAVPAPMLYLSLLPESAVPPRVLRAIRRFAYDNALVKVDWALSRPIPWTAADARRSPVVHVGGGIDELSGAYAELAGGRVPGRPFLVLGQYSMVDPGRGPEGHETAWAYTRVPRQVRGDAGGAVAGAWDAADAEAIASRVEERVEELAPGFRASVLARHVFTPRLLEQANPSLEGGSILGGTSRLFQQLVLRPVPGLARAETPVAGLYLGSASAHPGGGVHGACGANAARSALAHDRLRRIGL